MRVARWVWVEERAALLEEVVELALLVAGSALLVGEAAGRSRGLEEDIGDLVERNFFSWAEALLLFLDLLAAYHTPYLTSSQKTWSKVFSPFSCASKASFCLRMYLFCSS